MGHGKWGREQCDLQHTTEENFSFTFPQHKRSVTILKQNLACALLHPFRGDTFFGPVGEYVWSYGSIQRVHSFEFHLHWKGWGGGAQLARAKATIRSESSD